MQAVILGAGKSTRTYPLTVSKPKPMLKVAGHTLIEHNLDALSDLINEVIIVVGHHKEQLMSHLGERYKGVSITYVEQKEQNGTGGALLAAEGLLQEKFIVMNGDDIFSKNDIEKCINKKNCILVKEVEDLHRFGEVIIQDEKVIDIIEKPEKKHGYANTGLYVLSKEIFNHTLEVSPRGELEIIDYIKYLSGKIEYVVVEKYWLPITYPWNLLEANEFMLQDIEEKIEGEVEKNVAIKGNIQVGKGTVIKSGAYIEGPVIIGDDCVIGPNCYIRPFTTIGNGSKIGNAVDVKNTIIGDNSSIAHLAYIGDSVLGDTVNVAAGTITANLRHDHQNIKSEVKEELIDSGRKKLGAIIGDNVNLGINTSIYPGRKIWPNNGTVPGEIVKKDIQESNE